MNTKRFRPLVGLGVLLGSLAVSSVGVSSLAVSSVGVGSVGVGSVAAAAPSTAHSYVKVGQVYRPAFAWCDAPDRILAVTAPSPVLSGPNDVREVSLLRWLKKDPAKAGIFKYKLGPSEGAAGSSYVRLIPAGFRATPDLASQYFIQLSNVQRPPVYRMPRVVRFKTMQGENTCRYVPNTAFMGVTAKRTVIVWDEGDTVTYATRNFNGAPGLFVSGGKKGRSIEGGTTYEFRTEDGYEYHVWVDDMGPGTGSKVHVLRNGKAVSRESFLAYTVSVPKP